jgi:cell wall-associated NlpC family hydrolase
MAFFSHLTQNALVMLYLLLAVSHFYTIGSVVEMREEPSSSSKVVSQAIFAECIQYQDFRDDWVKIVTPDGYSGWALTKGFTTIQHSYETTIKTSRLKAHLYAIEDTEYGPILSLPYGSPLKVLDDSNARWYKVELPNGNQCFIQKGDAANEPHLKAKQELVAFSEKFLGLPYTWGGRSSFGYDCSGFLQMLYRQIGIQLQRDARQQILDDRFKEVALEELEPGDLIFFGKPDGKIGHVGMSIGDHRFIHASPRENMPWIRISSLQDFEWSGHPEAYYPQRSGRQLISRKPFEN